MLLTSPVRDNIAVECVAENRVVVAFSAAACHRLAVLTGDLGDNLAGIRPHEYDAHLDFGVCRAPYVDRSGIHLIAVEKHL